MQTAINHSDETLKQAEAICSANSVDNGICMYFVTLGQSSNSKDVRFVLYRLSLKQNRYIEPFKFQCILGDDLIESCIKAKSIVGTNPLVIDFERQNKIANYAKWTPEVIRFGKHYGLSLNEVPEKYVCWIANGCSIYNEDYKCWESKFFGGEEFMQTARKVAERLGYGKTIELTPNNFKFFTNEQYEKHLAKQAELALLVHDHHETNGKRVTKKLTIIRVGGYESQFGYTQIVTFKDGENKVYTYKGGSFPIQAVVGNTRTIMGTIKHGDYKGQKQTLLQRVKVLPYTFEEYKVLRLEYMCNRPENEALDILYSLVGDNSLFDKYEALLETKIA